MRAVTIFKTGGPEVLVSGEAQTPSPGPGQLQFAVAAAGVNFIETYQREGIYPLSLPRILGAEAAGTVTAVGQDVTDFKVGDRIATAEAATGTYAEYALVDQDKALPVPEGLDLETAAALPLQGMTAHYLARSVFQAAAGTTALVHAGAGGVGLLLIQILKAHGARVFTTVSSAAKAELARGAGADEVLDYAGFGERVRDLSEGRGVDVVYDGVGKDTFEQSLAALAVRGTLALFGAASGPVPPVDPQALNKAGSVFLTRPTLTDFLRTSSERQWRAADLFDAASEGILSVRIGARYSLAEAAQAHTDLQGRKTTGKVLLIP